MSDRDAAIASVKTSKKVQRSVESKHPKVPCQSCDRRLPAALGYRFCPTCWNVDVVCTVEGARDIRELADPTKARACLLWRVSDIVRRSGVSDAEDLIRALERRIS